MSTFRRMQEIVRRKSRIIKKYYTFVYALVHTIGNSIEWLCSNKHLNAFIYILMNWRFPYLFIVYDLVSIA